MRKERERGELDRDELKIEITEKEREKGERERDT